jgi:NitT/TauT family transport system substrate-binding protein
MVRRAVVTFVALGLQLAGLAHAQDLKTVRIGVVNLVSDVPFSIAERRGYFKEEGLKAELIVFDSGAKMIAPLGAGQLDAGGGATSAGLYNAIERGVNVRIVADKGTNTAEYSYKGLLVRKDLIASKKFTSLSDLKGKRVAIVANGAADNSVLHEALAKANLTEKDVEVVYLPFSQHRIAFHNEAIDAAISGEPELTMTVRAGEAVLFSGISDFYPIHQTAVVLFGSTLMQDRATGTKVLRAYLRGVRDYVASLKDGKIAGPGADEMIAEVSATTGNNDRAVLREMVAAYIDPTGTMNVPSLQRDLDFFKSQGLVKGGLTLSGAVDTSFVEGLRPTMGAMPGPGK